MANKRYLNISYDLLGLGIDGDSKLILAYIQSYTDDGRSFYGSVSTLAKTLHISESSVIRKLKTLTNDGYLKKEIISKNKPCHYTVSEEYREMFKIRGKTIQINHELDGLF